MKAGCGVSLWLHVIIMTNNYSHLYILLQLQDCVIAILDSTVHYDSGRNYHDVLEVDYEGNTPENMSDISLGNNIETIMKNQEYSQVITHTMLCF